VDLGGDEIEYAAGWLRGVWTGKNLPINLNRAAQPTRRIFETSHASVSDSEEMWSLSSFSD
jgi:hypothetical protein